MKKISILILIISLLLISCSKEVKTELSPGEHLMKVSENMQAQNAVDISADMKFDINPENITDLTDEEIPDEYFALMNNLSINLDYKVKADPEAFTFDYVMDYGIDYKEKTLLQMLMVLNEESFGFGISNFYDKIFAVDFDDLVSGIASFEGMENLGELELKKYIQIIMSDNEYKTQIKENEVYKQLITDYLNKSLSEGVSEEITYEKQGESVTENVLTYTFKYDIVDIIDLFIKVMNEAENDAAVKGYIQTMASDLIDQLISSKDYEIVGLTLMEAEEMQAAFEDEFDDVWQMLFEEMKAEFTDFDSIMDDETLLEMNRIYDSMDIKISINKDDMISHMKMSMDYEGLKYDVNYVINGFGDAVVIDDYSEKTVNILDYIDFNNLEEIQNKEELAKILKEFSSGAITELMEGEGFTSLYEDLKPLEETFGFKVSDITTYLGMGKLYIDNMTEEEIVEYLDDMMDMYSYDDYDYDYDESDDYEIRVLPQLDYVSLFVEEDLSDSFASNETWSAIENNMYGLMNERTVTSSETAYSDIENSIIQGADMVFVIGDALMPAIDQLAMFYPDVQFIPLEGMPEYYGVNMTYIDYYNEEVAYLAGYVAGMMSESKRIGFVGGIDEIYYQNFAVSYRDGALAADPDVTVDLYYTNNTDSIDMGYHAANDLIDNGVDFIYSASGKTGRGVVDACNENNVYVINHNDYYGVDMDSYVSTSLVDFYSIASDMMTYYNEGYISDYYAYGAADYMYLTYMNIPEEIYDLVLNLVNQITTGELFIPTYYGE